MRGRPVSNDHLRRTSPRVDDSRDPQRHRGTVTPEHTIGESETTSTAPGRRRPHEVSVSSGVTDPTYVDVLSGTFR